MNQATSAGLTPESKRSTRLPQGGTLSPADRAGHLEFRSPPTAHCEVEALPPAPSVSSSFACEDGSAWSRPVPNFPQNRSCHEKARPPRAYVIIRDGTGSNDATIQCLLQLIPNMLVLSDANNHASIINGIRSSKARCKIFKHNDVDDLERLLAEEPWNRPKIVVFESVYSMDGDVAPIRRIIEVAKAHNAMTYLDEVHAIGMYGPRGAGIAADLGIASEIDIIQGTMAKAIGVIGGYITGKSNLIDSIRSYASGFIFTTSLPPSTVAACLHNLRHLMASDTEREALHQKTQMLRDVLLTYSIPVMAQSTTHILPIRVGDAIKCKRPPDVFWSTIKYICSQ